MGQPRFIHDLRLPGMRHGRVLRAPSLTAQLAHPDQAVPTDVFEPGDLSSIHWVVDGRFMGVVAATERELQDFVGKRVADYKVPKKILLMDEIPKGATGKLQRIGLAQKLGLA